MTAVSEQRDSALQGLLDREEIKDCLLRYTRGVDRVDEELIRSAFHPEASDFHGAVNAGVEEFLAHWHPQQDGRDVSMHYIANCTIDLDGDIAHVETYFTYYQKLKGESTMMVSGGRYADRFERRELGWRIAVRVVIIEWLMEADGTLTTTYLGESRRGRRDRSDLAYARPLTGPLPA